jgi:hypothetical protein
MHTQIAGRLGRRRDHGPSHIVTQAGERSAAVRLKDRLVAAATAHDDGQAAQFRATQQQDGGVERIHFEMRDPTGYHMALMRAARSMAFWRDWGDPPIPCSGAGHDICAKWRSSELGMNRVRLP